MRKRYVTDFLTAQSSFFVGAGSVTNFWGSYYDYNFSSSPEEADYKALLSDWGMVGQDLQDALDMESAKFDGGNRENAESE